jgi:hypothetical protein
MIDTVLSIEGPYAPIGADDIAGVSSNCVRDAVVTFSGSVRIGGALACDPGAESVPLLQTGHLSYLSAL